MCFRHAQQQIKGLPYGTDVCLVLSGDIKRSPVRRCCNGNWQAASHGNTALKSHEFDRNLTLIVVHGDHRINLAAPGL